MAVTLYSLSGQWMSFWYIGTKRGARHFVLEDGRIPPHPGVRR